MMVEWRGDAGRLRCWFRPPIRITPMSDRVVLPWPGRRAGPHPAPEFQRRPVTKNPPPAAFAL